MDLMILLIQFADLLLNHLRYLTDQPLLLLLQLLSLLLQLLDVVNSPIKRLLQLTYHLPLPSQVVLRLNYG